MVLVAVLAMVLVAPRPEDEKVENTWIVTLLTMMLLVRDIIQRGWMAVAQGGSRKSCRVAKEKVMEKTSPCFKVGILTDENFNRLLQKLEVEAIPPGCILIITRFGRQTVDLSNILELPSPGELRKSLFYG